MSKQINIRRLAAALAGLALCSACSTRDEASYLDTTVAAGDVQPSMDGATGAPADLPTTDAGVVELGMAIDRHEVETASLAIDKAQNAEVREFARQMIEEHGRDTTALGQLALREKIVATGVTPGGGILTPLKEAHEKTMDRLRSSSATAFDRAYLDAMVDRHQQVLEILQHTHHGVQNAQLQNHVSTAIAMVQVHLDRALELVRVLEAQ